MRNNKKIINKIIYLAMSILILLNVVGIGIKDNINKKIHSNILIENINVGNLTEEEAIN